MAKLIKQVYDLVTLATDKGITEYHPSAQIMDAVHQGQMTLWRDLVKKFPEDKRVRNDLLPFEVRSVISLTSGIGNLPAGFEQEVEAWAVDANSVKRPLTFKEAGFFRAKTLDPIDPPTATDPIANIYFDSVRKIEVAPTTITSITLTHFKKPVKPVFAEIFASGQSLYDDANSVDVEWSDTMHDFLVRNALAILGLSMRDGQVQRAGQEPQPKEATL